MKKSWREKRKEKAESNMNVLPESTFVVIQGSVFEFRPKTDESPDSCYMRVQTTMRELVATNGVFVHESPRPSDQAMGQPVVSYLHLEPGMTVQVFPSDMFSRLMREQQAAAMRQQVHQSGGLIRS